MQCYIGEGARLGTLHAMKSSASSIQQKGLCREVIIQHLPAVERILWLLPRLINYRSKRLYSRKNKPLCLKFAVSTKHIFQKISDKDYYLHLFLSKPWIGRNDAIVVNSICLSHRVIYIYHNVMCLFVRTIIEESQTLVSMMYIRYVELTVVYCLSTLCVWSDNTQTSTTITVSTYF